MFVQLNLQSLSRSALLISAVGALMLAMLGTAPGAV
jgi:hypothetical protein